MLHKNGHIDYLAFGAWLLSLIILSRFFHVVSWIIISFFKWQNNIPLYGYSALFFTRLVFELFSLLGYHEWCCYEHSHTSFCVAMFLCPLELLDYMENLCGHVSQDHQTIFQSGRTLLHSHEQYLRVRVSPASPTLEGSTFLTIAIFVVVMWYLIVVFIWMCLMAYDADHVFMF